MDPIPIVVIILRNNKGEFFVHQRGPHKKTFPNKYGLGAGGHIDEGEKSEEAATRELFEETGLKTPIKYLFDISYRGDDFANNVSVFETKVNDRKVKHDEIEWQWSGWMDKDGVDALLNDNKLCPDTAILYRKFISIHT
jgi:8-oxo-dGTP pyrophosphatase MutT (NUDIX family)